MAKDSKWKHWAQVTKYAREEKEENLPQSSLSNAARKKQA